MEKLTRRQEDTLTFIKTYMVSHGFPPTVREIANQFNVSKSTVHKDLHDRLIKINKEKYIKVNKILKYHTCIRHIRGGESTRLKYKGMI